MMQNIDLQQMQTNAEQAALLLKALANKHRLLLLCMLNEKELSVGQLNEQLQLPQSTLSQHLGVLRKEGLVLTRRDAQTIHYSLASKEVQEIISTLYHLYCES
ncbi:ArsR/SmtB family transcription factor [Aliiglaciecola litoralis]|uniref:Metalloregulator ArsR/SmtB family transcription factor n=1 Tax=Aliiglaciecola litoralis TaxID=582857 RepID=A0ABN1LBV9_9ALTE